MDRSWFRVEGDAHGVAFSPNGKRLANGGKIWDAESGQEPLSRKGANSESPSVPMATVSKFIRQQSNNLRRLAAAGEA